MLDHVDTAALNLKHHFCVMIALNPNGRAMMKRDMELVRRILLAIKARKTAELVPLELPGTEEAALLRHLEMLHQEGLIDARVLRGGGEVHAVAISDMTWAGHDLLAAMENEGVWNKIKKSFTPDELTGMTITTMKTIGLGLLTEWAKSKVGLK